MGFGRGGGVVTSEPGRVYLIDDDAVTLASLERSLERAGHRVTAFDSPLAFLRDAVLEPPCCLVLDLRMPEASGLEVQQAVARRADWASVVFMSGCADLRSSVEAMKRGAIDFLVKPFAPSVLVAAAEAGLATSAARASAIAEQKAARHRLAQLSPRQRQVANLLAAGLRNAEIGARLGTSQKTVKFHRLALMRKLGIRSVAELMVLRFQAGEPPGCGAEDRASSR